MSSTRQTAIVVTLVSAAWAALGCSNIYYGAWERLGVHKREILVDRVGEARDEQAEAKEQFADALEQFMAVLNVEGGELEAAYDRLSSAYEASNDKAEAVRDRIKSVEKVSEALFEEWEAELGEYTNQSMRQSSEQQLRRTRSQYDKMIGLMRNAAEKMDPVLATFKDHVLFLKHSLNARAIASLQTEAKTLEAEVAKLIAEMEASIAEADAFIESLDEPQQRPAESG
jgi:hypothetical protein